MQSPDPIMKEKFAGFAFFLSDSTNFDPDSGGGLIHNTAEFCIYYYCIANLSLVYFL